MTAPPTHSDLKIAKVYRVFCTVAEMVADRGYAIRRPDVLRHVVGNAGAASPPITVSDFTKSFVHRVTNAAPGGAEVPNAGDDESDNEQDASGSSGQTEEVNRDALRMHCKLIQRVAVDEEGRVSTSGDQDAHGGLMVFFSTEDHVTVSGVLQCRHKAIKKKASSIIVVCQNRVFPSVRREVEEISGRVDEITGDQLVSIQLMEEDELLFNVTHHETVPKHYPLTADEAEAFLKSRELQVAQLPRMKREDPIAQYFGLERGRIVRIERQSESSGPYDMYRQII